MSKQKTPLAELIESFEEYHRESGSDSIDIDKLKEVITTVYFPKEREAFINAAQEVNLEKVSMTGEEWFNETYLQ